MKRAEFIRFKDSVMSASNNDPIWWAGYLWMNLTDRQFAQIRDILYSRADDFESTDTQIILPSGIGVMRECTSLDTTDAKRKHEVVDLDSSYPQPETMSQFLGRKLLPVR